MVYCLKKEASYMPILYSRIVISSSVESLFVQGFVLQFNKINEEAGRVIP